MRSHDEYRAEWLCGICPSCQTTRMMHESWTECGYCQRGKATLAGNYPTASISPLGRKRMEWVGEAREELGWTQLDLALQAGVSQGTIRRAESGELLKGDTRQRIREAIRQARMDRGLVA